MTVIFLDLDGVLNVEVFINAFWKICEIMELKRPESKKLRKEMMRDEYGNLFCPTASNMLAWIIEATGAKIVISSSWRHSSPNGLEFCQNMWKHRGLAGEIIDITPSFHENYNLPFKERAARGKEIDAWLSKNPVDSYVIFDDDDDMLPYQESNFIQTDEKYGITMRDAERAIKILNNIK